MLAPKNSRLKSDLRIFMSLLLLVAEAMDAACAGYRVGYESPSQFRRDYVRMFGLPPAKDAARLRGTATVSA